VNIALGNLAEPFFMGRRLRLSPIVILVALVFWGWAWGPIGMFLTVPLTIGLRISLENTKSLGRYAAMMGPVIAPKEHIWLRPAGGKPVRDPT
jgi:predicted PurR-regulated permease PerM